MVCQFPKKSGLRRAGMGKRRGGISLHFSWIDGDNMENKPKFDALCERERGQNGYVESVEKLHSAKASERKRLSFRSFFSL